MQFPFQPSVANATIPKYINFQGKLTKVSDGTNVANGTYAFEFKIYDALTVGNLLWTETYDQASGACGKLTVTSAVFNAKLGSCNALTIDMTGGALYISVNFALTGVSYDGEMSPRKQLVAAPFAFVANSVSGDGVINTTVSSATALTVAKAGTNYGLQVDTSTASAVTGLKITSAAAASGIALAAISSGTDENLTLNAKGAGSVSVNGTATGDILFGGGSGSTGCTVTNSTGAFACTAGGSFTTLALTGAITGATGYNGLVVTANTGVVTTGTWNGSVIGPAYGGTGVANNAASTLTISGNFGTTVTVSGTTAVTLPTSGTLATLAGTEELTNKTLNASVGKGTWTASGTWTLPAITLGGTVSGGGNNINNVIIGAVSPLAGTFTLLTASKAGLPLDVTNSTDATSNQVAKFSGTNATRANNDLIYQSFFLANSTGTQKEFGRINIKAPVVTDTSEDGSFILSVMSAGTLTDKLLLTKAALSPSADSGLTLGTASLAWTDLHLNTGGTINFENGNAVITHSSGILTVSTGDLRVTTAGTNAASVVTVGGTQTLTNKTLTSPAINTGTIGTSLVPTSNDGAALGNTTNQFSDLFLAEGGVINWDNGDLTLTQAGDVLTLAGGILALPTSGFSLNGTTVTSTAAQLNYLNAATGTTGTTSTNLVFSTSPSIATPTITGATVTMTDAAKTLSFKSNTASSLAVSDGTNNYLILDTRTGTSAVSTFTLQPGAAPSIASSSSSTFATETITPGTYTFTGTTNTTATGTAAPLGWLLNQPTIAGNGTRTITETSNAVINGPTIASSSSGTETITTAYGLNILAGSALNGTGGAVTTGVGLSVNAPTGATNNYSALFNGGNVGIGTTGYKLVVAGTNVTSQLNAAGNTEYAAQYWGNASDGIQGGFQIIGSAYADSTRRNNIELLNSTASGAIVFGAGSNAERMRITSAGNVGIGTTAPATLLHLRGANPLLTAADTTGAAATMTMGSTNGYAGWGHNRNFATGAHYNAGYATASYAMFVGVGESYHFWSTTPTNDAEPTERMRLDKNGNVGIGTTSPADQLQLSGATATKSSGTTWSNPSDERLKENINPFLDGLNVINAINPVTYTLNGLAGTPKGLTDIGIVAQSIKDIAPYTISTYQAKLHPEDTATTELYKFNASALTFVAINAIKELSVASVKYNTNQGFVLTVKDSETNLLTIDHVGTARFIGRIVVKKDVAVLGTVLGSTAIVGKNTSSETVHQGDLVMLTGATDVPVLGDNPTVTVAKAVSGSGVIVGIADRNLSDFNMDPDAVVTDDVTEIKPGEFMSIVITGTYKKVFVDGEVSVADKLTASSTAGKAMRLDPAASGQVFGISLDIAVAADGSIRVMLLGNYAQQSPQSIVQNPSTSSVSPTPPPPPAEEPPADNGGDETLPPDNAPPGP